MFAPQRESRRRNSGTAGYSEKWDDQSSVCLKSVAVSQKNISTCNSIDDSQINSSCISDVARSLQDEKLCFDIKIESKKNSCFKYLALDTKNHILCENINDSKERDMCYAFIAGDKEGCERITNEKMKQNCHNNLNKISQ